MVKFSSVAILTIVFILTHIVLIVATSRPLSITFTAIVLKIRANAMTRPMSSIIWEKTVNWSRSLFHSP